MVLLVLLSTTALWIENAILESKNGQLVPLALLRRNLVLLLVFGFDDGSVGNAKFWDGRRPFVDRLRRAYFSRHWD